MGEGHQPFDSARDGMLTYIVQLGRYPEGFGGSKSKLKY
jgi:hypothetical protein